MITLIFLFVLLFCDTQCSNELFKNPDFENHNYDNNWRCSGCRLTSSGQSYHGHSSVYVSHRTHSSSGLGQNVSVTPGHTYVYSARMKLLNNTAGHMYDTVELMVAETHYNGKITRKMPAYVPYVQKEFDWFEIGFDHKVAPGIHYIYPYIQIKSTSVTYLVDSASFKELPADPQWKTHANNWIHNHRKAPINIQIHDGHHHNRSHMYFELKQVRSKFAFGSVVDARMIVDNIHHNYQKFFYDNFEYGVLGNALKWRFVEWSQGHINMDTPMLAVNALRSKGITVRGHNMFWAVPGNSPNWVSHQTSSQLLHDMHKHVNDVISQTRGKLIHWDVNNEALHGDFFAQHTGNPNITMDMFNWIHQTEPGVKLFLNDYNVVSSHSATTAYKDQALRYRKAGVPVYGIGVQCHTGPGRDPVTVKYRLDKLAEAGLPIWITELTVNETDENKKADVLEDLLTVFFSHPAVEGVILWGYWDGRIWIHDSALASGSNVTPNAAGRRYQHLFHTQWRTHAVTQSTSKMGFMGDYTLNVKYYGKVIQTQNFTLGHGGANVTVNL